MSQPVEIQVKTIIIIIITQTLELHYYILSDATASTAHLVKLPQVWRGILTELILILFSISDAACPWFFSFFQDMTLKRGVIRLLFAFC